MEFVCAVCPPVQGCAHSHTYAYLTLPLQVDPQEAAISALKRELRLLRAENAYLREQLFQANMPRAPGTLPPTAPGSRLPTAPGTASGHRHSGDGSAAIPAGSVQPSPFTAGTAAGGPAAVDQASETLEGGFQAAASGAPGGRAGTSRGPSRPPSALAGGGSAVPAAGAGPAGAALLAAQASSITSEELLRRLLVRKSVHEELLGLSSGVAGFSSRSLVVKYTLTATVTYVFDFPAKVGVCCHWLFVATADIASS